MKLHQSFIFISLSVLLFLVVSPFISSAQSLNLRVTVCNGSDCGPTPDVTPPSVPTNLSATAVSSSQINISWDSSTDPIVGGAITSGVAGYYIYRNDDGAPTYSTTGASYSDTSLAEDTLYSYKVSAFDNAGNVSAQSLSVSTTTLAA